MQKRYAHAVLPCKLALQEVPSNDALMMDFLEGYIYILSYIYYNGVNGSLRTTARYSNKLDIQISMYMMVGSWLEGRVMCRILGSTLQEVWV